MVSLRKAASLFLIVIISLRIAASDDIYFSKIGIEHGLSQLTVMSIYQDELGTMWFGTREGVNRYNGSSIEVFNPVQSDTNSLGGSNIKNICGNQAGQVFIQTPGSINEYNLYTGQMQIIDRNTVTDAIAYGKNCLWIAERNTLYSYCNGKKKSYLAFPTGTSATKCIFQSSDERLFIGTISSGVIVIDQNKKSRTALGDCSPVSSIFEDSKKNIWIGTWQNGLYKLNNDGSTENYTATNPLSRYKISADFVRAIAEDNNGNIWVGTKNGLDKLSIESGIVKHYSADESNDRQLSNESVWALTKDKQGTIWVGTYFGGVNYFNPEIDFYTFHNFTNGSLQNKPYPIISDIIEDENNNLYLCTEGDGLIYYNPKTKIYKNYRTETSNTNSLSTNNIKTSYYDRANHTLWLGMHLGGLCKFDTKTATITRYSKVKPEWEQSDVVRAIIPYHNKLLIGTYNGIFSFEPETGVFEPLRIKGKELVRYCVDMKLDDKNRLWIAGNGLMWYNITTGASKTYQPENNDSTSIANNGIIKLLIDKHHTMWVATSGGGVNRFNEAGHNFVRYDSKHSGLKNDFISNIRESQYGYLIVTTTHGFSILDAENNKTFNYGIENGLPLNSLYNGGICVTRSGEIYIAGMNGMVSFFEENLTVPHRPYTVNLINLSINNMPVKPGDKSGILKQSLPFTREITLDYTQTMITIEVASNNYIPANRPIFRYKVEGFSNQWTTIPQAINKLNFMNLSAGNYMLMVEAVSPVDGLVVASTNLKIVVKPPYYKTWYAYIAYVLLVLLMIWRYLIFNHSKVLLKTSLEYEKKQIEHIEEVNQSKLRFFTNISHEFRTPLTLIAGQVDMLLQMHKVQPAIYNRILSIKRNTANMQNLINELLEFRKSEQGHLTLKVSEHDLVKFLYEIYISFSEYANFRQINFNFECTDEAIPMWFDATQLQKVVYNLISNAFKYTPKNGHVSLVVSQNIDSATIEVYDSGIGIGEEAIEKVFDRFYQAENGLQINHQFPGTGIGLALTKNIIESHLAQIFVESTAQVGSKFTITLKKGSAHFAKDQIVEANDETTEIKAQLNGMEEFMQEIISTQVTDSEPEFTILIVEDNPELLEMLKNIFESIYKVQTAVDGVEGLEKTIEIQPDIVLSDLMMPRMTGSEMCSKIKNNLMVCHIPVVLLTAQTALEFNIEGLRLGADDYITKPFNVKTLISRCNNLVNGRRILQEKFSKQTGTSPRLIATNNMDREFIEKAMAVIEKYLAEPEFDVPLFSREMGLGRTKLFSKIKGITGQTPNDFIINVKMKKAADLLLNHPEYNISDITYMLGFNTPKYFTKCFKEQFGVPPSAYRKSEETEEIEETDHSENNDD